MATKEDTGRTSGRRSSTADVSSIKYLATRKNIPPAGLEAQGEIRDTAKAPYYYNPHLPPVLRSAPDAAATDALPELLREATRRPLSESEAAVLAKALRRHEPWLEWSGKRERPWFAVDPVALHMHERVSTQAVLRVLARQDVQRDLFADPQLDYARAVQFYRHDVDWANRMIIGDSLQVMASLAHREDLAGKVQMIYVDPPYGIKFASNFQPQLGQRDVRDRQQDLTREPEMVKAYRDTWTLGVHSYLSYLRDRLMMARELLSETGSIFVQISDDNVHLIRSVMDEVFGPDNFISLVSFVKTSGFASDLIDRVTDYIVWFARDSNRVKYRQLYQEKELGYSGTKGYNYVEMPNGLRRKLGATDFETLSGVDGARLFKAGGMDSQGATKTRSDFLFEGRTLRPGSNSHWKASPEGLDRLRRAEKLVLVGNTLSYVRYADSFPVFPLNNVWTDTGIAGYGDPKLFVVQTNSKVIERCVLMTTDPGDLVLDPTCGSGTTAYVAEQWGRRWITIDTSRVALTLAKHRLMTAPVRLLPTPGVERGGRGAQPWWDLDRRNRRRGEAQRGAVDVRLQDGAAHHAQKHRAQHVARSDFGPARIDPHRRARHAEPHGCQRQPRTEAETGRETGQQASPRRRCRGLRRGRASLASARYDARLG